MTRAGSKDDDDDAADALPDAWPIPVEYAELDLLSFDPWACATPRILRPVPVVS